MEYERNASNTPDDGDHPPPESPVTRPGNDGWDSGKSGGAIPLLPEVACSGYDSLGLIGSGDPMSRAPSRRIERRV